MEEREKTNDDWICQSCKYEWREENPFIHWGECPECGSDYVEHY